MVQYLTGRYSLVRTHPASIPVVIPTHEAVELSPRQLQASHDQPYPGSSEVLVIDNRSKDELHGTIAPFLHDKCPRLGLKPVHEPHKVNYAPKLALRAAEGGDADDLMAASWLHDLLMQRRRNPGRYNSSLAWGWCRIRSSYFCLFIAIAALI